MTDLSPVRRDYCLTFIQSRALAKAVREIPDSIWAATFEEMLLSFHPTPVDEEIKLRYWSLYAKAVLLDKNFSLTHLHNGICTYTNLYNHFLTNPKRLAWMMKSDNFFETSLRSMRTEALEKLFEIIQPEIACDDPKETHRRAQRALRAVSLVFGIYDLDIK